MYLFNGYKPPSIALVAVHLNLGFDFWNNE